MFRRKVSTRYLFRHIHRKMFNGDFPFRTIRVTLHALRWVFMLVFLFITVGILVLFATGGNGYFMVILGYSITGFFTFFMGYFGWIFAQSVIDMITGEDKKMKKGAIYYFRSLKRKVKNHDR